MLQPKQRQLQALPVLKAIGGLSISIEAGRSNLGCDRVTSAPIEKRPAQQLRSGRAFIDQGTMDRLEPHNKPLDAQVMTPAA